MAKHSVIEREKGNKLVLKQQSCCNLTARPSLRDHFLKLLFKLLLLLGSIHKLRHTLRGTEGVDEV